MFKYVLVRYKPILELDEGRLPLGILVANDKGDDALLICVTSFLIWPDHTPGKPHQITHVVPAAASIFSHSKSCFGEHILTRLRAVTFGTFGVSEPQDFPGGRDDLESVSRSLFSTLVLADPAYTASPPEWETIKFTESPRRRRMTLWTRSNRPTPRLSSG